MKPSPLSFAAKLTHEQQEELYALLQTKTLADGVAWCEALGVKTSDSSVSAWFKRYRMLRKMEGYDQAADELAARLAKRGIDPLLAPKLAQQVFLLQAAEAEDAETFETMTKIIQRHVEFEAAKEQQAAVIDIKRTQNKQRDRALEQAQQKITQQDRRIKLLEKKITATKNDLANPKLTEEQRAARMRSRFGVV